MRLFLLPAALMLAGNLAAQAPARTPVVPAVNYTPAATGEAFGPQAAEFMDNLHPGLKIALGFLLPGVPQYFLGHSRSYAYFAAEVVSLTGMVYYNSQAHNRLDRYHIIARDARRNFVLGGLRNNATESSDIVRNGIGEYYEDLTKWPSSGDYDNDPSQEGIQPETDTRTYNGHQWDIARINNYTGTSGGLPVPKSTDEEARALAAYEAAVYPVGLNWDWTGIEGEEAQYHRIFNSAEVSYRHRKKFTLVFLTNHTISAIDMLILVKLNQSRKMRGHGLSLNLSPTPAAAGSTTWLSFALSLNRQF